MQVVQDRGVKFLKTLKDNRIVILLGLVLIIDIFSVSFFTRPNEQGLLLVSEQVVETTPALRNFDSAQIPKISEIRGSRIDDEAAMTVVEETLSKTTQARKCIILPVEIWVFLLVAFIALLVFNLAYNFERATKIQWGWELALALLPLVAWYVWDGCRAYVWFPLYSIKMGIIIYALYLYFFDQKKNFGKK